MCFRKLTAAINRLASAIEQSNKPATKTGGEIVYIVKDDFPAVGYQISGVTASDAEGHVIPDAKLTYVVTSTDIDVLELTVDPTDQTKGTVGFGAPGMASLEVSVEDEHGNQIGALGSQFTVTAGDPKSILGGSISFDGLTEAAPNP